MRNIGKSIKSILFNCYHYLFCLIVFSCRKSVVLRKMKSVCWCLRSSALFLMCQTFQKLTKFEGGLKSEACLTINWNFLLNSDEKMVFMSGSNEIIISCFYYIFDVLFEVINCFHQSVPKSKHGPLVCLSTIYSSLHRLLLGIRTLSTSRLTMNFSNRKDLSRSGSYWLLISYKYFKLTK